MDERDELRLGCIYYYGWNYPVTSDIKGIRKEKYAW